MSLKIQTFGFYPAQLRNTEHQLMDFRRLRLYRQAALSEQEHGAYIPGQHTLLLFDSPCAGRHHRGKKRRQFR